VCVCVCARARACVCNGDLLSADSVSAVSVMHSFP
jgi:hypothetical protein